MSATLKINVCNTQHHVSATSRLNIYNMENEYLQHQKYLDLIFETFTWNTHNMLRTRMQHVHNDCDMKRDQLQHAKNIITTPIYNNCNIDTMLYSLLQHTKNYTATSQGT
jgi:hypothetical protein